MFTLQVFFQVLSGKIKGELGQVNIAFCLVFDNSQVFLCPDKCRFAVLDAYFLVDFLVCQAADIKLDEKVAFFYPSSFGDDVCNGSSAFNLIFDYYLVSGLDSARLDKAYCQWTAFNLVCRAVNFSVAFGFQQLPRY
jgi:hypothetical protein